MMMITIDLIPFPWCLLGEKVALKKLEDRLENERQAIAKGQLQINIYQPNLVNASR